ncbi:major facilitator superfamily domain-containing protein [Mycena rosella]|uniref:Major facilitator superfamily domain-containing protein n=1 Tax=Mycena rosella TaxID=1033263 RepID=A0AAD7DW17_MYCRO|nr:major facilitator superfamily domain-containing protein [Mycena rosella]
MSDSMILQPCPVSSAAAIRPDAQLQPDANPNTAHGEKGSLGTHEDVPEGWGLVWGVFQDYYHTNKFPDTSLSTLSLVGGLFSSQQLQGSYNRLARCRPINSPLENDSAQLPSWLCLLASAFATKLYQIFLFQGCLLGLSLAISMPLYMALSSQWFLRRRGLATGIAPCGAGIGGGIESLLVRPFLSHLSCRSAMLVYSSIYAALWTVAWFMMAERRAPGHASVQKHWLPSNIGPAFYSIASSVFVGIFGYLSPYYFITTYVKDQIPSLDRKSLLVVVPLVVMNISGKPPLPFAAFFFLIAIPGGIGRILAGQLADRFGPIDMFFASFFLGALAQLLWTFAHTYAAVIAFALVYGLVGCWFLGLLPVVPAVGRVDRRRGVCCVGRELARGGAVLGVHDAAWARVGDGLSGLATTHIERVDGVSR